MKISLFNIWYFVCLFLSIDLFLAFYMLLKKRSDKVKKIVLWSVLAFALLLHFLKALIPPYSTDAYRLYSDSWFINICGANIALFPFMFFSKNKYIKDYMFYLGILGGLISVLYPMEPMLKLDQAAEVLDIIRFYIHHNILWQVPLLMVIFKLHNLDYKRVWAVPIVFSLVMVFIMINQVLQSELGYVGLRNSNDFFGIGYKNTSYIWGPSDAIGEFIARFCPGIFKTVPVGKYAGQEKYWPLIWLIVPMYLLLMPICFLMSLIFEHKHLKSDLKELKEILKTKL